MLLRNPRKWHLPALLICAIFFSEITASGAIVINEIQASNSTTLADKDGDFNDWIELYNNGTDAVNLEGWGLTDKPGNPFKWTFPQVTLGAGKYLIVYASGKNPPPPVSYATPNDIPGLVMRLRPTSLSNNNNRRVTNWTDSSGLGNNATATTATAPYSFLNQVNGQKAVRFTKASGQILNLKRGDFNGLSSLNNFAMYFVMRWTGDGALDGIWGATGDGTSTNSHLEIRDANGQLRWRAGNQDFSTPSGTVPKNTWVALGAETNGTGENLWAKLFKNGTEVASKSGGTGTTILSNYSGFFIGASHTTDENKRYFQGEIAEVLFFNRALNTDDRNFLQQYFHDTYALPAPASSPNAELHANFSINADGEEIVLTMPDGSVADRVPAVENFDDASYGRSPNGTGDFAYFITPTPGAANNGTAYGAPIAKPKFSQPRGYQSVPFQLTLSHSDPQATVIFTTDGSEPALQNGTVFTAPIFINSTTIVRAAAFKNGALPLKKNATYSYLFLDDIINVTARPAAYPFIWRNQNATTQQGGQNWGGVSYSLSPFYTAQTGYAAEMKTALQKLPVIAITASIDDLFGTDGVYSNPLLEGHEKVASVEWIAADGTWEIQENAGLRVQGGASREFPKSPKKSLRLLFKDAYGPSKLKAPVLKGSGTALKEFNTIILRADFNNSWVHHESGQRLRGGLVRDKFLRDSQIAMSGIGAHSNHAHLFINGIYWGVYNPSERPDSAFAAAYFGGEKEEYDAMTHDGLRDGDNVSWEAMKTLANAGVTSDAAYAQMAQLLNIDAFIDYLLVNFYGGNQDWPHNNWNATSHRTNGTGWTFFAWDGERTLEDINHNCVDVGNQSGSTDDFYQIIYKKIRENTEFKLRFADRVQQAFFNNGALTPANAAARYTAISDSIQTAMFGEQVRWGAYRQEVNGTSPRYTVASHFVAEKNRLLTAYFPARTNTVLSQLRNIGLYPAVNAPVFSQHGGLWTGGEAVSITTTSGAIYFTTDGSDPRLPGGAIAATAQIYTGAIPLNATTQLQARAKDGSTWSALTTAQFHIEAAEVDFLPNGTAPWNANSNWSGGAFPNAPASKARIASPTANRNVDLEQPTTIGQIRFIQNNATARNRIRAQLASNSLTFDGGASPAKIIVEGNGTGYVEFELQSHAILRGDLILQIDQLGGDPEFGALRLRQSWNGTGGLIKTGAGMMSLTGEDKDFSGAIQINEGVICITEPSTPFNAESITIASGGQLRLTSANPSAGVPRIHNYPVPIVISGEGRGGEIPESDHQGKLGALRYDPGSDNNTAILNAQVILANDADIHIDRQSNTLELAKGLGGGVRTLSKTGGGTLRIGGISTAFTGEIQIANGTVALAANLVSPVSLSQTAILSGFGSIGAISGDGTILLDGVILRAENFSQNNATLAAVFQRSASPDFGNAANSGNGLLTLNDTDYAPAKIRVYLRENGTVFRGGILVPNDTDCTAFFGSTTFEILAPSTSGLHQFQGQGWLPVSNAQVSFSTVTAGFADGAIDGKILTIVRGDAPVSFDIWRQINFPNDTDFNDAQISGALADPQNIGVPNLLRYALGIGAFSRVESNLPRIARNNGTTEFSFPFDAQKTDIAYIVEVSDDLKDWTRESALFDSRIHNGTAQNGWLKITDDTAAQRRFYRLKIVQLP